MLVSGGEELLDRKIALSNIESIQFESLDLSNSFISGIGVLAALAVVFVIVSIIVITDWVGK